MGSRYATLRKHWRAIDTEQDLRAIWRGERFEADEAVEEALRVYELALRVDGWEDVKGWAREAMGEGRILHAHVVEIAMRSIEQRDEGFFVEITHRLLNTAAPQYFRFWHTLFNPPHSLRGTSIPAPTHRTVGLSRGEVSSLVAHI